MANISENSNIKLGLTVSLALMVAGIGLWAGSLQAGQFDTNGQLHRFRDFALGRFQSQEQINKQLLEDTAATKANTELIIKLMEKQKN
ncbi:MAG: hypothetical protein KF767_08855 [Bdellovibrionaceae bacterium]|nr:hypothetical protein [Pseudobdellovibrionaceae bacterium]